MYCSVPPRKVDRKNSSSNIILDQNVVAGSAQNSQRDSPANLAPSLPVAAARGRSQQLRPLETNSNSFMMSSGVFSSPPTSTTIQQQQVTAMTTIAPAQSGGGFAIFGKQTGEEKIFSAVDVRESKGHRSASITEAEAQQRRLNRNNSIAMSDADRIRKLEQELRKSQELVRKKNADLEALKEKQKQQSADAAALAQREKDDAIEALSKQHDESMKALQMKLQSISNQLEKSNDERRRKEAEDNEASRKREAEQNASATMWSTERTLMTKEVEKLKQQLDAESARGKSLISDLHKMRDERDKLKSSTSDKESELMKLLAEAEAEIRRLKEVIESQRENVAAWKKRVEDCNSFILQICQPKFSVVKDDDARTPMTQEEAALASASSEVKGFVLVPLLLMLEAYELLPRDAKQMIATKYEDERKHK